MLPTLLADIDAVAAVFIGGTLLLLAGIALGWGLGRVLRRVPTPAVATERETIAALLAPLMNWTTGVSSDVSEYRTLIEAISDQIAVAAKQGDPSLVATTGLMAQMLEANRSLQSRLDNAEATLQQQSGEIAAYISQARTDVLTGLNNRRVFDEQLSTSLAAWHAQNKPVGVVLFDIDHFKILNDTQGHLAGDAVLREMAALLRQHACSGTVLARYGGEEFACIVTGATQPEICQTAEALRAAVEGTLFLYERTSLRVTISCGAALATFNEDAFGLLKRGDNALYAAKSAGRNSVYLHDGYHCVPYSNHARPQVTATPGNPEVQHFHQVCDDLRSRLAQITVSSAATSA